MRTKLSMLFLRARSISWIKMIRLSPNSIYKITIHSFRLCQIISLLMCVAPRAWSFILSCAPFFSIYCVRDPILSKSHQIIISSWSWWTTRLSLIYLFPNCVFWRLRFCIKIWRIIVPGTREHLSPRFLLCLSDGISSPFSPDRSITVVMAGSWTIFV